ncbi:isochorismate synthase [Streptomyces sp. OfavH-34-F]|uniref:isochorismate synthase n=1 Tax=Streptomyces sp. OfavH-34-F TaxID=2917760 RepID=UPI001EF1AA19|nr:isochorismate synthase [Streptomyces sp. OfavH-34-F]MCG7526209.1 isochorismate synthase [Streptomyces sp. OfavH-34-F]
MSVDTAPSPGVFTLTPDERTALVDACRAGVERARATGHHALVSWAVACAPADPFAIWAGARRHAGRSLYWQSAWDGATVLAFGSAHDLRGTGAGRIPAVRAAWTELVRDAVTDGGGYGAGPLAVGGFAFGDGTGAAPGELPEALLWVPLLQLRSSAPSGPPGGTHPAELRVNALVDGSDDPGLVAQALALRAERCLAARDTSGPKPSPRPRASVDTPDADAWKDLVRRATDRMRAGDFEKVVLARRVDITADREFDVPAAVRRMRETYAGTTVFALGHGDTTFLGATPEYLVRVEDRDVHSLGLAGTTPRGKTPAEDRALEAELSGSTKLLHEHEVVVRMLSGALAETCVDVEAEAGPQVLKLAHVQHLSTPVRGRLPEGSAEGVLGLAARLQPTPALGGHPRAEALEWLARNEGFDRGWYAGGVGWADQEGNGEFAVAIRSALVRGASASLYAGCGLVADSDPEVEYAETCAKLRPMRAALGLD